MSDTTTPLSGGSATTGAKTPFRVPFLSGRIPLGRTAAATSSTSTPLTQSDETGKSDVSPLQTEKANEVTSAGVSPKESADVTALDQSVASSVTAESVTTQEISDKGGVVSESETKISKEEDIPSVAENSITEPFEQTLVAEKSETEQEKASVGELSDKHASDASITLGLRMVEVLAALRKRQDDFFALKEGEFTGTARTLIERRAELSLSFVKPEERMMFCLTFLTAAVSRSSATLIEASFLLRAGKQNPVAFVDKLISFKQDAWEEVRNGGLPDETSAVLALAPLLTLISIKNIYGAKGDTATDEKKGINEEAVQDAETIVQVGEDIWTVVRDQLKKLKPETTAADIENKESSFNSLVGTAVEEIQKNGRAYNIEGGVRILIPGSTINRKAIYDLLVDIEKRVADVVSPTTPQYTAEKTGDALVANQLNALQTITGETGIAAPSSATEITPTENTTSAVDDSNSDTVSQMFLDDALVRIIKLICKVDDTKNLEMCFKKYASLTMKDFMVAVQAESPLIQTEVTAFLNWAKNSYLKEKLSVFDGMTLVLVLTTVERGVSGALNSAAANPVAIQ